MEVLMYLKDKPGVHFGVRGLARKFNMKRKTVQKILCEDVNFKRSANYEVGSMKAKVNCYHYINGTNS